MKYNIEDLTSKLETGVKEGSEKDADIRTKEVQAESVAYVVCQYLGLDTSDYSFGYVAGWSSGKEVSELQESMEIIQKTSKEIIEKIDSCIISCQFFQNIS